jgi:hypothetical protein
MAHVAEHLPSKREAMVSNSSVAKKLLWKISLIEISLSLSNSHSLPTPHLSFFLVGVGNWFYDAFLILLIHITGILAGLTGETSVDELGQF